MNRDGPLILDVMSIINKIILVSKFVLALPIIVVVGLIGAMQGLYQGIADWIKNPKPKQPVVPVKHKIPDRFKDLIPLAERIGIGDDVVRMEIEEKLSENDKQEIREQLRGRTKDLSKWIDSINNADEAVPFIYLLEAVDEMGIWPDKDE